MEHTIQNPDFNDTKDYFHEYITNHIEKFENHLGKDDFKLVFDKGFYSDIKQDLRYKLTIIDLKSFQSFGLNFLFEEVIKFLIHLKRV